MLLFTAIHCPNVLAMNMYICFCQVKCFIRSVLYVNLSYTEFIVGMLLVKCMSVCMHREGIKPNLGEYTRARDMLYMK
jgi:hypothetical protein